MNKGKKNLGVKIETALLEKLDQEAARTRRTRSQTIEVLIDNLSIDSNSIIEDQAKKIKELEREVILLRSDKQVLPEIDTSLIEENKKLTEQLDKYKGILFDIKEEEKAITLAAMNLSSLVKAANE